MCVCVCVCVCVYLCVGVGVEGSVSNGYTCVGCVYRMDSCKVQGMLHALYDHPETHTIDLFGKQSNYATKFPKLTLFSNKKIGH